MRVLIISHMYPSSSNEVAGIFVHEQVKALADAGIGVRVLSPTPWIPWPVSYLNQRWKATSRMPREATWESVQVYYPRYAVFPRGWFFASSGARMYRGIRRNVELLYQDFSFDLIHAHVALPDGYAGALLANTFGVPLVVTIHGQDLESVVHRSTGCRTALARTLPRAARVMVVSHKLARYMERFFSAEKERVVVVPNGVDPKKIHEGTVLPLREDGDGPLIVSVSNLIKRKGVDVNLQALHQLRAKYPSVRYVVVGEGPEASRLKEIARDLRLQGHVRFVGRIPHQSALQYIAAAEVFSLPSWNEAFGVAYLEAMGCGKAVVGCKGEGLEDFVKDRVTGLLVEPKNVADLVRALDFLLSHPNEMRAMGDRARHLVLEDYTWRKNAEKTIEIYREALRG